MKSGCVGLSLLVGLMLIGCKSTDYGLTKQEKQQIRDDLATRSARLSDFLADSNATGQYTLESLKEGGSNGFWWVVVYDAKTDSSMAVDMSKYDPAGDITQFMNNKANFYYNLQAIPGHYEADTSWNSTCQCYEADTTWVPTKYMHPATGILFEKGHASPKDLETMAAFQEDFEVERTAENLRVGLGLSVERSQEVARLVRSWGKTGHRSLTKKEQDSFYQELIGAKMSDIERAIDRAKDGKELKNKIDELVEVAAQQNGTTPEQIRQIVEEVIGE